MCCSVLLLYVDYGVLVYLFVYVQLWLLFSICLLIENIHYVLRPNWSSSDTQFSHPEQLLLLVVRFRFVTSRVQFHSFVGRISLVLVCGSFWHVCLLHQMHVACWQTIVFLHSIGVKFRSRNPRIRP
jgi:hypothetical protein